MVRVINAVTDSLEPNHPTTDTKSVALYTRVSCFHPNVLISYTGMTVFVSPKEAAQYAMMNAICYVRGEGNANEEIPCDVNKKL